MMVLYFLFIAFDRLGGGGGGEEVHCNNVLLKEYEFNFYMTIYKYIDPF